MANTRELRRRIKSVKNTSQITKAMQMVAATKMRKAQEQASAGRPYLENLSASVLRLLPKINSESHPLLNNNGVKTVGVVLISTDKGLVGALNTNLLRFLSSHIESGTPLFYTIGKKGRMYVIRTGQNLQADFENTDLVTFRQAKQLARLIIEDFKKREVGQVDLIYPHFLSTLRQEPRRVRLLPINLESIIHDQPPANSREVASDGEFLFEPNPDILLDYILVHHLEEQIYQALLESKASQYSAQMIAMQNATDNAKELVGDLQLTYNQTRQAAITTELLEITTAQVAME